MLYGYQPAVKIRKNVKTFIVEKPGLIDGMVKFFKIGAEIVDYHIEIIGWVDSETLVYRVKKDGRGYEQPHAFSLITRKSTVYSGALENINPERCYVKTCISMYFEWGKGEGYTQGYAFISPDGKKYAFLSSYIYGPKDLLVVAP